MDNLTKEAEADAEALLATAWTTGALPIDPVTIAASLGIRAYETKLDANVSGALVKRRDQDPVIYVNENDSVNRQRFSFAHELGHFVRRTNSNEVAEEYEWVDLRGDLAAAGSDEQEMYANKFAAALLMPAPLLRSFVKQGKTVVQLSYLFEVSGESMQYRLRNLGLL